MTRIPTIVVFILSIIAFAGCGSGVEPDAAAPVSLETTTYRVEGMHCDGCANAIAKKVGDVEGVSVCTVDLESGIATVEAAPRSEASIQKAIARLGYKVEPAADPIGG